MKDSAQDRFRRWFVEPMQILEELPNGDWGFIVLATSCYLYERYAIACLKESGLCAEATTKNRDFVKQIAVDFNTDKDTAKLFWEVIRNGLLHQAMPKRKQHGKGLPPWRFSHEYHVPLQLSTAGPSTLEVEPWHFRDRVLSHWEARPDLIKKNNSFPWAIVEDEQ